MNRRLFVAAAIITAVSWLGLAEAHAEILQFRAQAQAGGAGGQGIGGDRADDAFHAGAAGVSYGALVGVEFMLIDAWIEHNQYQNSGGLAGTWTQFMAGLDTQFDISEKSRGDKDSRYAPTFVEMGMAIGFGVGTGQQVDPPLDNSEISDKGILAQIQLGLGYRLNKTMSVGVSVPIQGSYIIKNEGAANDQGLHYQSVQGAALLNFRVDLTIK